MTVPTISPNSPLPLRARLIDAAFWLLAQLPLTALHRLGAALGELAWRLPGRYRDRLNENLAHAYPAASAKAAARAAGQMMIEMPYWWKRDPAVEVPRWCANQDWSAIDAALAEGHGAILLTPHFGGFEALAAICAEHIPLTVLFRPPHEVWLRDWIAQVRVKRNLRTAPADLSGVRTLVRTLRSGKAVGILPDQVPSAGEGVWAPFYGKPAYSMSLAHRLHHLTGAPVFVLVNERLPATQGYRVHIRRLDALPLDPAAGMAQVNAAMEAMIGVAPEQYLWSYNRYKNPGVSGPDEA